jgi:FkbM family methyltransferase
LDKHIEGEIMSGLVLKEFRDHKMWLIKKDSGISRTLQKGQMAYDRREFAFMEILRSSIKKGDYCADFGANIGFVSLQMAKIVGSLGRVFAFEPNKLNVEVLKRNRDINGYKNIIIIKRAAISDFCGESDFYLSDKSNLGALSKNAHCSGKTEKVRIMTVDKLFSDMPLPDFYKMDVEGHEVNILNGMKETAMRAKLGTKILMEVHPQFYSKNLNMEESLWNMVDMGFTFKYVISAGVPIPDKFAEKGYAPTIKYDNFSRAVYEGISAEDAIEFCSKTHKQWMPTKNKYSPKIVRAIMLEKERQR